MEGKKAKMVGSSKYICPDRHITCDINLGECPVCHKKMILDMPRDWMDNLIDGSDLWSEKVMTDFPAIISYEYWRFREQIIKKRPYGAVFMIKDLMETVLKFFVLSAFAWAKAEDVPDCNTSILPLITSPNLSLGNWMELGRRILLFSRTNNSFSLPQELYSSLEHIVKFYNTNNFVNWRNEIIGHGALSDIDDLAFQQDIEKKVKQFYLLFGKIESATSMIALSSEKRLLKGYLNARNLEDEQHLFIRFEDSKKTIDIDPFIVIIEGGLFFFDNQKSRKYSQLQCYPTGERLTRSIAYFNELSRALKENRINPDHTINEEYRSIEEDTALNLIGITSEYTEPNYITEWFKDKVSTYSKGIFALEMSRGMGKSTFAERVNSLRNNPIIISDDLDVRTYHISRAQLMGTADFETAIETQWMADYNGRIRVAAPRVKDFERNTRTKQEMFSAFLSDYLSYTKKTRNKNRIAVFIDGLDEITDDHIWDYFPNENELEDGIFVFLAFRLNEKSNPLSMNIVSHIKKLQLTDKVTISPDSPENIKFLTRYVDAKLPSNTNNYCNKLLSAANKRILYLSIVCRLAASGYPISELVDESTVILSYFQEIKKQYGEKEYFRFCELSVLFCTYGIGESLSINDIAFILYDGRITYDLLGKLSDLMPFLNVQRGTIIEGAAYKGENRYRLANPVLGNNLKRIIPRWQSIVANIKEIAIQNAADAVFSGREKYSRFSADELVVFDRIMNSSNDDKERPTFKKRGAIGLLMSDNPDQADMVFEDGEEISFENENGIQLEYLSRETTLLLLVHLSDTIEDKEKDGYIWRLILGNLNAILQFLENMSYSRRMLDIELVRKASVGIADLLEANNACEAFLEQYFHMTVMK